MVLRADMFEFPQRTRMRHDVASLVHDGAATNHNSKHVHYREKIRKMLRW